MDLEMLTNKTLPLSEKSTCFLVASSCVPSHFCLELEEVLLNFCWYSLLQRHLDRVVCIHTFVNGPHGLPTRKAWEVFNF